MSWHSLKGKFIPVLFLTEHHAMKAYWRSGSIASRILELGTRWRWMVSFTSGQFYPQGKSPWYTLYRRLGGTQSRSGLGGEEKNSQPLPGLDILIMQPVAQRHTIKLSRFLTFPYRLLFQILYVLSLCTIYSYRHTSFCGRFISIRTLTPSIDKEDKSHIEPMPYIDHSIVKTVCGHSDA
jgi:hypothetical protein